MFCPETRMNTHFFVSAKFVCILLLYLTGFLLPSYASVAQVYIQQQIDSRLNLSYILSIIE